MRPLLASEGDPTATARRFREAHEGDWRRLDAILTVAERRSLKALDEEELMALPVLYRQALSSLSVARETSLDRALVDYLESLCARAYFYLYGVRTPALQRLRQFFLHDWSAAVRAVWPETLVALLLSIAGFIAAYVLITHDSTWFFSIIPQDLAAGRDPTASATQLKETLYGAGDEDGLSIFATFLFTHNAQVAIFAFALGFAFGVPSSLLLVYNGCMMGAFFALFVPHGLGEELGGWLAIHGTTEMLAIILAGAAGLRIGRTVAFPGARTRLRAAAEAGRASATVMAGVVVMLMVAGLLEGIGRQRIDNDAIRYAIGGAALLLWLLYFYWPRRAPHG
ncbi:stage II sporulation protein M [Sphingomonas sp. DBB INV C78]|uniref:stage II sporulation protein M n=1 Tax=Sphingomonas sp. DBB INV C78 TaxID=3349434 RepID=UPI0036D2321A